MKIISSRYAIALVLIAAPLASQTSPIADSMMMLNRTGKWAQAIALAKSRLPTQTESQARCEILASQSYSELRVAEHTALKDTASARTQARTTLAAAFDTCTKAGPNPEIEAQLFALRADHAVNRVFIAGPQVLTAKVAEDRFWKTGNAAAQSMNEAVLAEHLALCRETGGDACFIARHGVIVQEWYSPLYHEPMYGMSSTKSVASLLTGMLIADGKIGGIEDRVCKYIDTWCTGLRGKVTIRHLLTQTSGLPDMRDSSVGFRGKKNSYVISLQPTREPGTVWTYSNEGVQLLSPILSKAAGEPIENYARRRLFEPLGMRNSRLHSSDGDAWVYADMETTARDFARLGILAANRGLWNGKQIVPSAWIDLSSRSSQMLHPDYGLLWWLDPASGSFAAEGYLGTDIRIVPDLDLVIVRMQSVPLASGDQEMVYREKLSGMIRRMDKGTP